MEEIKITGKSGEQVFRNLDEQKFLRQAMSAIGAIAWQWDLDSGVFSYSRSLAEELGLEGEPGQPGLFERINRDEQVSLLQSAERSLRGSEAFEHLVHIQIGPDYHPFRIIGSRVDAGRGKNRCMAGILLAGVDTGFLLNSILNNTSVLVYVKDLHGHYLFANREYAQVCRIDQNYILGKTDRDLFNEDIAGQLQRFEQWVIHSAEPVHIEERLPFGASNRTYLSGRFPIYNSQGAIYALGGVFTDITQIKTYENTIKKQRRELALVLDAVPSQIWYLGRRGEIRAINRKVSDALGVSIHAVKGKKLLEIRPEIPHAAQRQKCIMHVIQTGKPILGAIEQQVEHGQPTWNRVDTIPMPGGERTLGENGVPRASSGVLLVVSDITELKRNEEILEYQATHDSLTLLPNRKKLYFEAQTGIGALVAGKILALMLIDLDRFKEINDTLGHHIGDRLLKQLGPRLEVIAARHDGLVARLGGDEFAVMLTNVSEAQARAVADAILATIGQTFDLGGFKAEISASLGISFCPKHGQDVGTLMRYADVAMYRAKTESVGVLEYAPEFDKHTPKRLALMTDLGRAIRENQLRLHFQPKIDVNGKFVHGFEALLRWEHPEHGRVPPGEFIPLAETTELIHPLTLWVLEAALAQCRRWRGNGLNMKVAVNLSTRNLLDEQIVRHVENALAKHGVPANALELEITESAIMADPKRTLATLKKMDALGVHLSIDDYGSGYSSLAYIKRLPVETLKIDYSFVVDMLADEQDAIIVRSTINLAHNLGLKVVAEGVENEAVLEKLYGMGCDQAQGYYIGKPMAAGAVESWLRLGKWSSLYLMV